MNSTTSTGTATPAPIVATKTKTFFGRLLAHIAAIFGSTFHSLLSQAEAAYAALPAATQAAMLHGSGVIAFLSTELTMLPADLEAAIIKQYPDLNVTELEKGLFALAEGFGLNPTAGDLTGTIGKLQKYLGSLTGSVWSGIAAGAANILAVILAPKGTIFGAVTQLMEYVYQTFIAKKTAAAAPSS